MKDKGRSRSQAARAFRIRILGSNLCVIYIVSPKKYHSSFRHNFGKCLPIFKILLLLDSATNLQQDHCYIFHCTLLYSHGVIITEICCVFEHFSIIICDQRDPLLRGRAASRVVGRHKRPHTVRVLI